MYFLYNLLLISFFLFSSPYWLYKILKEKKYRKGLREKFGILPSEFKTSLQGKLRVHVHAVSVGEVIAAIPFIKELKRRHPEISLIVSTTTPTGNEVARKQISEADCITYFPFDFPWSVRRFLDVINPFLYISIETEIWPNFLRSLKKRGIKSLVINGRISPDSYRGYNLVRPFIKKVLGTVDLFCVQTMDDADRLKALGTANESIVVTGNMKYDRQFLEIDKSAIERKMRLFGIREGEKLIIAGSTHKGEEEIILNAYRECIRREGNKVRLIIAPRHIERAGEIEYLVMSEGFKTLRRTDISNTIGHAVLSGNVNASPVIILDTIGELATLYAIATVVIIGGSFIPHGGQNPLEALFYRKPVLFGKYMFNFKEISGEILRYKAGIMVKNPEELSSRLITILGDFERCEEMGKRGYQIIVKNRGALHRNITIVEQFLPRNQAPHMV